MTEQKYVEEQMKIMLEKNYDHLYQTREGKAKLELGTKEEYVEERMKSWREGMLDADTESLSEEEIIMIQNADSAAQNVKFGSAPIPDGATDLMKVMSETDYYEISRSGDEMLMSKGQDGINKFTMPVDVFKTMVKHFVDAGIDSMDESNEKNFYKTHSIRIPIEK